MMWKAITRLLFRSKRDKSGYVLVIAVVLAFLVAAAAASALRLVLSEYRLSVHSSRWAQAIHTAEAGIELACEEFHKELMTSGSGWAEWTSGGSNILYISYTDLIPAADPSLVSQYTVTVNTNTYTITAIGRMSVGTFSEPAERTVEVVIQPELWWPFQYAMLAKGQITLCGNAFLDSFDSTDPNKSTDGQYDSSKKQGNATVASVSSSEGTIDAGGSAVLFGDLETGPGGTVAIGGSFLQVGGDISDDCEYDIPDVTVPIPTNYTHAAINGTETIVVTNALDMSVPSITLGGSEVLTISGEGDVTIYCDSAASFSGNSQFNVTPSPEDTNLLVELYVNGNILLNDVMNSPGYAKDLAIYGTTNCLAVDFTGNDDISATIYVPQAHTHLRGNGAFSGAIVSGSIWNNGTADFHYDESLATGGTPQVLGYELVSWLEL